MDYTRIALTTVFATFVASGCTADTTGAYDPDRGPDDVIEEEPELDPVVAGTYHLESQLEVPAGALEEHAGYAAVILAMTDDPDDPATWVLDRIESQLSWPYDSALGAARSALGLDGMVNDLIADYAPELVADLITLGEDLNAVSRDLHLGSTLVIYPAYDGSLIGDHTVTGVTYVVGGGSYQFTAAEVGLGSMSAPGVAITADREQVAIGEHAFAVDYGRLIAFGIDNAVVASRDPQAASLGDWLAARFGCAAIGDYIEDVVELGSNETYADACASAVRAATDYLLDPLTGLEAEVELAGAGTPVANDDMVDTIDGTWTGALYLPGDVIELDGAFTADRAAAF